jgi:hypothetical protein
VLGFLLTALPPYRQILLLVNLVGLLFFRFNLSASDDADGLLKRSNTNGNQKQTVVDQTTVTENGIILYREATKIIEDGVELTKTYHRSSLTPGQDLTGQPAQVVAIANTVWTDEVIAAYQAEQAERETL